MAPSSPSLPQARQRTGSTRGTPLLDSDQFGDAYRGKPIGISRPPPRGRPGTIRAIVSAAAAAFIVYSVYNKAYPTLPALPHTCDSLAALGTLRVNLTNPLSTQWLPLDDQCPPLPDYLPALWHLTHGDETPEPTYPLSNFNEDYQLVAAKALPPQPVNETLVNITRATYDLNPVSFLQKKRKHPPTVLIMGDSVDRNGLIHFCQMLRTNLSISHYANLNDHPPDAPAGDLTLSHGPKFDGWDQRGLPHRCEIPFAESSGKKGTALRVINGFHYGMDALDEFNTPGHSDWHAPGRVEVRIDKLFIPMIDQLGGADKVDLVIFHSGMWDLALFGMQDDKTSWALTKALTAEQLAWWQDRMRRVLAHVRHRFPKARLVLRKQHRVDEALKGTPYITNLRVHQLRHLQEEIARSEGVPTFDYNHVLEGYQVFQERVHPMLVPGGVMYGQNVLHQLRVAMESPTNWRKGAWGGA